MNLLYRNKEELSNFWKSYKVFIVDVKRRDKGIFTKALDIKRKIARIYLLYD